MLPKKILRPCAFIANTHPSTKPGEHWVAIYVSPKGKGEYFDSYGLPPLQKDIKNYMEEQCPNGWKYNPFVLQDANSFTFGYYCVLYVISKSHGLKFCTFVKLFYKNKLVNDIMVYNLVKENTKCIQ